MSSLYPDKNTVPRVAVAHRSPYPRLSVCSCSCLQTSFRALSSRTSALLRVSHLAIGAPFLFAFGWAACGIGEVCDKL